MAVRRLTVAAIFDEFVERILDRYFVVQGLLLIIVGLHFQVIDHILNEMRTFHFAATRSILQDGEVNVQMIEGRWIVEKGTNVIRRRSVLFRDEFLEQGEKRFIRWRERMARSVPGSSRVPFPASECVQVSNLGYCECCET